MPREGNNPPLPLHEAVGAIHVHTTRSDGCLEPGPILDLADREGLQFLCFTDHNTLALGDQGWHGRRHGGVLSVVGAELEHTSRKSHALVFGVSNLPPRGPILRQLEKVKADGGLAFAAHPTEIRPRIPFFPAYSWKHGTPDLLDGVEIWNWMSMWKGGVTPFSLMKRMNDPDPWVRHPHRPAVGFWFQVGGAALGGADAHGHTLLFRKVFDYGFLFRRIRTHLLLKEPLSNPAQVHEALGAARCFVSNALAGDARGFRAEAAGGRLRVELPGEGWITMMSKGRPPVHTPMLMPGTHDLPCPGLPLHLEVYRKGRTWITCSLGREEGGRG